MQERYDLESQFEKDLVDLLVQKKGWTDGVIDHPDEQALMDNWADILLKNNCGKDRLNGVPLSKGEMAQIMEQVRAADTPFKANRLINGGSLHITRDNPNDPANIGKTVYLRIFERSAVAGGKSVYQIAKQPRFKARAGVLPDRRGDVMLLINGLPVIHIELKRSGVPWTDALHQIEKYTFEHVFDGLFSLVQIFVCMTPEETRYLANPGLEGLGARTGSFNRKLVFTWGDGNNLPVQDWRGIAESLLSIPMAHLMVSTYTVADAGDGERLKALRSYQCAAVAAIKNKLSEAKVLWGVQRPEGGFIWHTTGSGKTLTSFKAAQTAAAAQLVDKSVFLVDRVELGTQSLIEYRGFSDPRENVNDTESSSELLGLLLDSSDSGKTLILTSIHKMSKAAKLLAADDRKRARLAGKRIAIIVDECHRTTFGEMMAEIKRAFPMAMLIGFTGTPIAKENAKESVTTADLFGPQLAQYTLADGIRDGNVLGFQLAKVETFPSEKLRAAVALRAANCKDEDEAFKNPQAKKTYLEHMDAGKHPMAGFWDEEDRYHRGIEDMLPKEQFDNDGHRAKVVEDIKNRWNTVTLGGRLHALLATSSIPEAMAYYRLIKREMPEIKVTCLFDPSLDNSEGCVLKEETMIEILEDYESSYGLRFGLSRFSDMKADAAARMAHKGPYRNVESDPSAKLDLMIVVNQMLTGYDSKWLGALFLDKTLEYEHIIQALSRTNRLLDAEKTCGTIRYYRKVHTMERDIQLAMRLYCGDVPMGLIVRSICENVETINEAANTIKRVFEEAGIPDLSRLPEPDEAKAMFAKEFGVLSRALRAAKVQGFTFGETHYTCETFGSEETQEADCTLDRDTYEALCLRYAELGKKKGKGADPSAPFDVDPSLAVLDTKRIDKDYIGSLFAGCAQVIERNGSEDEFEAALDKLHSAYPRLSTEDQEGLNRVVYGLKAGEIAAVPDWDWTDYINHIRKTDLENRLTAAASRLGVDRDKLAELAHARPTTDTINEYGRFDDLLAGTDRQRAHAALEQLSGAEVRPRDTMRIVDAVLRRLVLEGCDIAKAVREECEGRQGS